MQLAQLLERMVDAGASDLHLRVPSPPVLRIDGALILQEDLPQLMAANIEMVSVTKAVAFGYLDVEELQMGGLQAVVT